MTLVRKLQESKKAARKHFHIIKIISMYSIPKRTCCDTHVSCEIKGSKDRILVPKLVRRHPSEQIRQQYLRKLGIVNDSRNRPLKSSSTSQPFLRNSSDVALRRFSYQDDLNDYGSSSNSSSWASKTGTSPTTIIGFSDAATWGRRSKRSVSFSESVSVQLIPHKDMYSRRIKKLLSEGDERAENSRRNSIEFASENWDWRQACEEDQFYTCPDTGNKIHPAHVHWLDQIMANRHLASLNQCLAMLPRQILEPFTFFSHRERVHAAHTITHSG